MEGGQAVRSVSLGGELRARCFAAHADVAGDQSAEERMVLVLHTPASSFSSNLSGEGGRGGATEGGRRGREGELREEKQGEKRKERKKEGGEKGGNKKRKGGGRTDRTPVDAKALEREQGLQHPRRVLEEQAVVGQGDILDVLGGNAVALPVARVPVLLGQVELLQTMVPHHRPLPEDRLHPQRLLLLVAKLVPRRGLQENLVPAAVASLEEVGVDGSKVEAPSLARVEGPERRDACLHADKEACPVQPALAVGEHDDPEALVQQGGSRHGSDAAESSLLRLIAILRPGVGHVPSLPETKLGLHQRAKGVDGNPGPLQLLQEATPLSLPDPIRPPPPACLWAVREQEHRTLRRRGIRTDRILSHPKPAAGERETSPTRGVWARG
eukprot:747191-Hanusia_phi.AAC.3